MSIWMRNRDKVGGDLAHQIEYRLYNEHIAEGKRVERLTGFAVAPPRSAGDFIKVVLGANSDGSNPGIEMLLWNAPSSREISRVVGGWCTNVTDNNPANRSDLMMQTQNGRRVTYRGDFEFRPDLVYFTTNGLWREESNGFGWPPDICAAAFFRCEARRTTQGDSRGLGTASMFLASRCHEGEPELPSDIAFGTQIIGLTQVGQPYISRDELRLVLEPGASTFSVKVNSNCEGIVLFSGYELLPT